MQTTTNSDVITFAFPALEAVYILFSCISHICRDLWRMLLSRPGYRTQLYETIFCSAKLDSARYENVLDSCALRPDLEILPAGDSTEIGERVCSFVSFQRS